MMKSELKLYKLSEVERHWIESTQDEDITEIIQDLLNPQDFYLDGDRIKETYYLGYDKNKFKFLLVEQSIILKCKKEIEEKIEMELVGLPSFKSYEKVKQVRFSTKSDLKNTFNSIEIHNQKVNSKANKKEEMKFKFNYANQLMQKINNNSNQVTSNFIAIDIEAYYLDQKAILEIGWSMYESNLNLFRSRHIIIREHFHLNNEKLGMNVKDRFYFGKSEVMSLVNGMRELQKDLNKLGHFCLIGHAIQNEIKYFKSMGLTVKYDHIFDTDDFNKVLMDTNDSISLTKLCDRLDINGYSFHNAGNDAHYTLRAFLIMTRYIPRD